MTRFLRSLALAVAVLTGGLVATSARAESPGVMRVDDAAGLFSTEAVSKVKDNFSGTTFRSTTHYLVVTADHVPSDKKSDWEAIVKAKDDAGKKKLFADWAKSVAKAKDRHGDVVTLVYREKNNGPTHSVTISDAQSDVYRHFNDGKALKVDEIFVRAMRKIKSEKLDGEGAKKEMDAALTSATELVISDLKDTSAPEPSRKVGSKNNVSNTRDGGSKVGGYICMFLCVALGIWLVIGIIRALTGGGGGYGGGGYGGGGYGGGGGGFFSSLMGGMFGAMAGMWMYNSFFGGHNDMMAGDSYGNDGGATDTGDGDYDGGAQGGDGDWGDGGGDAGGGGDWGGDAGGGGDWGGGGGDFGGGGGDFGGGGDW